MTKLEDLANMLCINRHTLQNAVKVSTGKTFRNYKQEMLLRRATDLFCRDGLLTQKQIAAMLGYSSREAFTRFIKRKTGLSPKLLRLSARPKRP